MKSAKSTAIVLTTSARSQIVSAYVAGLNATENTGSLLHTVCEIGAKHLKGAAMSDDDIKHVSQGIANAKGWKGASLAARVSETRVILRSLHVLPDALDAFKDKAKQCTWHDGMKLARKLNAGKSVAQAVKLALEKGENNGTPEGRVAGALKAWFKKSPRKRAAILSAAATLGLKLGVKLDA
jgi:hypothetical protein